MTPVIGLRYLSVLLTTCMLSISVLDTSSMSFAASRSSSKSTDLKKRFLKRHCYECHRGDDAEGNLDLSQLTLDLSEPHTHHAWSRMIDRVKHGEMPPEDADQPSMGESKIFVAQSSKWLHEHDKQTYATKGRVLGRRLSPLQIERSLQHVLGIDLPLAHHFPSTSTQRFATIAEGQVMSRYFTQKLLEVIDLSLDHAFERALTEEKKFELKYDAKALSRKPLNGNGREPELRQGLATTWLANIEFFGRMLKTEATESGWVRTTFKAKAIRPVNGSLWCSVRSGQLTESASTQDWIGYIAATPKFQTWQFDHYLPKGHKLVIKPLDRSIKGLNTANVTTVGTADKKKLPGVGIEWLKIERIFKQADQAGVRKLLFDNLSFKKHQKQAPLYKVHKNYKTGKTFKEKIGTETVITYTVNPRQKVRDLKRLLLAFATRAYRRPTTAAEIQPYIKIAFNGISKGATFTEALRLGYRSILCSPRFLYLQEQPGQLDDYAMASRLSYMLWQAPPDETLLELARKKQLQQERVIQSQLERMLEDDQGKHFIKDLAHDWLDLKDINFTTPENYIAPSFDAIVQQSMLDETHTFLQHLLDTNQSVSHLIDSRYTFLNNRLARFYELPNIQGEQMRQVTLPANSPRGGLLGQGAILKVTANGSSTSPVVRGIWLLENLLGEHVPPPPPNVPAVEPDVRGVTSIRDILAKHREVASCASCHKVIDPPGFALENFDPAGQWRKIYKFGPGKKSKYKIDASYALKDGRKFADVKAFKKLIVSDKKKLARNVVDQFLTFGTGAKIGFHDRPVVDRIVQSTARDDYGFRSLLKASILSSIFRHK